jgi:carbon-monoxide dehydrogenase iron sulfur subunit
MEGLMTKRFLVDPTKCTECNRCVMACSLEKLGVVQPQEARIKINRQWPEPPLMEVCIFEECPGQPCIASCPFGAIEGVDGKVFIIADLCKGCTKCIAACPSHAIRMVGQLAVKCDLCGGTPACIAECVTNALTFIG